MKIVVKEIDHIDPSSLYVLQIGLLLWIWIIIIDHTE